MLITRVELENIKSYHHLSVEFRRGTTAISGANGAGKTTIVEAIGFALFDYLPYSQMRFVREGEKYGRVVVHLIGGDDRPYVVERRCGSGSRWSIFDEEANLRLEQSADVLDKLHELFGIDHGRPFDSLFRDALGVPQGTFTSIFLETTGKRKQTFDALLQIEDYKTAADYLLDAQKQYKTQIQEQQGKINQLTYETRNLDEWRIKLKEARLLDEQQKQQNVQWTAQLTHSQERLVILNEQYNHLKALEQRYATSQATYQNAQNILATREQQVYQARSAQEIVVASQTDFQRYGEANEALKQLRQDAQRRNGLRLQHAQLHNALATVQANAKNWQARLADVAVAQQKVEELTPLVGQQIALEEQRDEAIKKVERYEAIVTESKRLNQQLTMHQQKQEALQRKIDEIEPLAPIADCLQERTEILTQLRIQMSERNSKDKQLQQKRESLREKMLEQNQTTEKLRKAENNVFIIEEHRQEAEEMPLLQKQYDDLSAQKHRLEGNIEGYTKWRAQSVGGQCPLLHESCLNIKQRGLVSLEFYFEGLLKEEHSQLAGINQQQQTIMERIGQIKKYAEALNKLGLYIERRDTLAEQSQRIGIEIARLEQDGADLMQELEALRLVEPRMKEMEAAYNESKAADKKVRELAGLYKQVQQFQEQARQWEADLQERRQEAELLRGSDALLNHIRAELGNLNDPRSRHQTQLSIVAQESHFTQQLQAQQQQAEQTQQQIQALSEQLTAYNTLDEDIGYQEAISQQCQEGYQNYLQNENQARLLPEYERVYQQQLSTTERAAQMLQETEQAFHSAQAAFREEERSSVNAEINQLQTALAALAQDMQHHQEYINSLEQQIARAEELRLELEAAQQEYQTLEDLHAMMEQFRKLIKEAAPHVLKAMLADISAEANRIFGEIMGDRSAQLSWQNDYEVVLRRQGVNRSFAQLSGGEQMSAALAVRLALLKKLSTLNIAFFDEPTQNMDELRRMNLADQIRRVRGFDQLIVISHDDTFEQSLDSLIRLHKVNGATHVLRDEETMGSIQQVDTYAS